VRVAARGPPACSAYATLNAAHAVEELQQASPRSNRRLATEARATPLCTAQRPFQRRRCFTSRCCAKSPQGGHCARGAAHRAPVARRGTAARHEGESNIAINEAAVDQGGAKSAVLNNEGNLVPGFAGRLVYIMDESKETANEECYIKSMAVIGTHVQVVVSLGPRSWSSSGIPADAQHGRRARGGLSELRESTCTRSGSSTRRGPHQSDELGRAALPVI
jgi:hypothetical protein